jgi:hypothetical protein
MHGRVLRYFSILLLLIVPAVAQTDQRARTGALTYSPWAKSCFADTCATGSEGRANNECWPTISAALVERQGDLRKILRIALPPRINSKRRVGITSTASVRSVECR